MLIHQKAVHYPRPIKAHAKLDRRGVHTPPDGWLVFTPGSERVETGYEGECCDDDNLKEVERQQKDYNVK